MKLLTAIVQGDDAPILLDVLTKRGYRATRINTAGGFLKKSNATLLLGIDEEQIDEVLETIRTNCQRRLEWANPAPIGPGLDDFLLVQPIEVEVGGATIFIQDVEQFVRL